MQTMSYKLIATTVVGTVALYLLDAAGRRSVQHSGDNSRRAAAWLDVRQDPLRQEVDAWKIACIQLRGCKRPTNNALSIRQQKP